MEVTGDERPLRRDAVRSLEKISVAAMEVFAEHGLDVSIAEVADRAGVGVGTVYRRFGDKDRLIAALFAQKVEEVIHLAEDALSDPDPDHAFLNFCVLCSELFAENKGLRQLLLGNNFPATELSSDAAARLQPLREALIQRAKESGWLRDSFEVSDFPLMMVAVQAVRDVGGSQQPDLWRRVLRLCIDGARQDARVPTDLAVPPALNHAELRAAIERRTSQFEVAVDHVAEGLTDDNSHRPLGSDGQCSREPRAPEDR